MEQEPEPPLPLNLCHANKSQAIINRVQAFITLLALAFLIYYRAGFFFPKEITNPNYASIPLLPWLLIFLAELLLSFIWLLSQALRWRPVTRTVFPERLPKDEKLPAIDVFVCTADPSKEPTINVMNTVISAMAMDYPVDKLNVYLSDDGGASVTLNGLKEAWMFAKFWLPFCNKYGVKTRCPEAYFSQDHEVPGGMVMVKPSNDQEFAQDRRILKMTLIMQVGQSMERFFEDNGNARLRQSVWKTRRNDGLQRALRHEGHYNPKMMSNCEGAMCLEDIRVGKEGHILSFAPDTVKISL
ncbi:hypothetical protein Dimus_028723 [Dionaea muscipula]